MATYATKFGNIEYDNSGNDHRPGMVNFVPRFPRRHEAIKAQRPAVKAFQEAERRYGRKLAKRKGWRWGRRARAIGLTGSWRSFELQRSLWQSDPGRFASPYVSGHVQGVAVDLNTTNADFELQRTILKEVGWQQVRADEPWHWSLGPRV